MNGYGGDIMEMLLIYDYYYGDAGDATTI